jgi:hypothetical protein
MLAQGQKTIGTVIDLNHSKNMTAPIIGFKDQKGGSHVYHSDTYTNIDPYEVGQALELYYDPADPDKVMLKDGSLIQWIPLLFLFTHGGVGFGGLIWLERKRRLKKWLLNQGQEIMATLTEIKVTSNKGQYYTMICQWEEPYTHVSYTFKSDASRRNPSEFVSIGALIRVLIDPADPKRYWVDDSMI